MQAVVLLHYRGRGGKIKRSIFINIRFDTKKRRKGSSGTAAGTYRQEQKMEFTLETWKKEHIPSVAKYADNEKIAGRLRDSFPYPYTEDDAEWFVQDCMEKEGITQLARAIIVNGEAVGSITVMLNDDVYCKSAELGYWLGEPFWGRGIMTAAVETMCREGFAAWDIVRIHAEAFARNAASRRVLEKAGFALEGTLRRSVYKNGEMLDSCIYALVREEAP